MSKDRTVPRNDLWVAMGVGPMARDALAAVGCRYDGEEVRIQVRDDEVTLNGGIVPEPDAALVFKAWQCDPNPFREMPAERVVQHVRRSITIRAMLP